MSSCAIVTGHSRGLGAAVTDELLRRGVATLGLSRNASGRGSGQAARLQELALDLRDPAALGAWLAGPALAAWAQGHQQLLLVNNAGTLDPMGPLGLQDPQAVAGAVNLNVTAPLMLAAAVAALPAPGLQRRILHVSSGAARTPYAGWSVYCATKAALDQHARAASLDGVAGLRVCSLAPGVIDTSMQAALRSVDVARFPLRERFEQLQREGRLASPADCARRLVDHLLGDSFGEQPVVDLRELAAAS